MHWEILDKSRRDLLPKLAFLKSFGFYLAGGTGLALHLGHRKSVDFDFYTPVAFNELQFEQSVVQHLTGYRVTQRSMGTLIGQLGPVEVTFFYYSYPLLEPPLETENICLASVSDIAAMKLMALSQRGLRRDFIDIYTIAQQHDLATMLGWATKKFPQLDPYPVIRALTYFEDAEHDESGRGMATKTPVAWSKVKDYFSREAVLLSKRLL